MSDRITPAELRRVILFAAFVYLAITFISSIVKIILVFSIIVLLTIILTPFVTRLERHKIPRAVSAFAVALVMVGLTVLVAGLLIPRFIAEFWSLISATPEYIMRIRDWLGTQFPSASTEIPVITSGQVVREGISRVVPLLGGLTGYALSAADVIVSMLVILISVIYVLSSPQPLIQGLLALIPNSHRQKAVDTFQTITSQMRAWALATVVGMAIIFILTWTALALLGVKSAFLVAIVAGVLEIVPVLGPFLSGALAVMIALGQSPTLALWTFVVFVGIQQVEGHLVVPLVMSGQLKLHPVSVIFSVLVMGALFGIVGVFLATPAAAIVKILVYDYYISPRQDVEKQEIDEKTEQIIGATEPTPTENHPDDTESG